MAYRDFIEVIPSEGVEPAGWWYVVEGRDGVDDVVDDWVATKAEAEKAGRGYKVGWEQGEDEQRREIAMEAGMLGGIDAYNDAMGY